jgi:hypothetical protein
MHHERGLTSCVCTTRPTGTTRRGHAQPGWWGVGWGGVNLIVYNLRY